MAVALKIPWTKRDEYRYLWECKLDDDLNIVGTSSYGSCTKLNDAEEGPSETDGPQIKPNQSSQSAHEYDSKFQMEPSMAPNRSKAKYTGEYPLCPTLESNGIGSRVGEGDFVDMPTTREYMDLQKGGVSIPDTADELDSPTKLTASLTSSEHLTEKKEKKKLYSKQISRDDVDYELGQVSFTYFDVVIYIFSIGSYLADVGSDCWVAYMYYTGM